MTQNTVCCAGKTPALRHARQQLAAAGIATEDVPRWSTRHLLLDVPSFRPGLWQEQELYTLTSALPPQVTVWGGQLTHPAVEGFQQVDFLRDEDYLVENARITAQCAMTILEAHLNHPWSDAPALILGWGRIGKQMAKLLAQKGCPVTVATGTPVHGNHIAREGYPSIEYCRMADRLPDFRLLINTAPAMMVPQEAAAQCIDCVKLDLASVRGIGGEDVIWARALPGRLAPEQSGRLIARRFLELWKEESA